MAGRENNGNNNAKLFLKFKKWASRFFQRVIRYNREHLRFKRRRAPITKLKLR